MPLKDAEIRHFALEELTNLRMPSGNEAVPLLWLGGQAKVENLHNRETIASTGI